jgi:osmotically-inducible protein OsmY
MANTYYDPHWDRYWRQREEERLHHEWNRARQHEHDHDPDYPVEKHWRPENQGVQPGSGTFGGTNYGGVIGTSAWGSGAERYSITDPYGNDWYVKQLKKGRHTGLGPAGYKRSDSRIREDVCDRLTYHPEIDASGIEVAVEHGEVTLSGTVPNRRTKWEAEEVAEHVFGAKDVRNEIRVPRDTSSRPTNEAA